MDARNGLPTVIAIGYSVRALVDACAHAGLSCVAVDHFGDADTRKFACDRWIQLTLTEASLLSEETNAALQAVATELRLQNQRVVFLLAGGMENLGAACVQLRSIAVVLGPSESQRSALRDVLFLQALATECGLRMPAMQAMNGSVEDASSWLWKPLLGAGGLHISRQIGITQSANEGYWQRFVQGKSIGVSCLVDSVGEVRILGATGGFDAFDWPGPLEFIYRGSYGPLALSSASESKIESLCKRIYDRTGYSGWLQFDFVREENDSEDRSEMWLLECNPRWTAGMEVLLHAGRLNPVSELLRSLRSALPTASSVLGANLLTGTSSATGATAMYAKAVLYAKRPIELNADAIAKLQRIDGLADLPFEPQLIEAGHPVVTVRAGLPDAESIEPVADREKSAKWRLLEALRLKADLVWDAITPKT